MTIHVGSKLLEVSESVAKFLRDNPLHEDDTKVEVLVLPHDQDLSEVDSNYSSWTAKEFVDAISNNDKLLSLSQEYLRSLNSWSNTYVFVTPLDEQCFYEMGVLKTSCLVMVLLEGAFRPSIVLADDDFTVVASRAALLKALQED